MVNIFLENILFRNNWSLKLEESHKYIITRKKMVRDLGYSKNMVP